jgi:hypothetical protein
MNTIRGNKSIAKKEANNVTIDGGKRKFEESTDFGNNETISSKRIKREEVVDEIEDKTTTIETVSTVRKETEVFDFIVRVQLVTGNGKTDTYIGKEKENGKLWFLKGPFVDNEGIRIARYLALFKKQYNIPTIEIYEDWLISDRWSEGVPLGLRNSLVDRMEKPYPFLRCPSIYNHEDEISRSQQSSVKWPVTEVVAGSTKSGSKGRYVIEGKGESFEPMLFPLPQAGANTLMEILWKDYLHALAVRLKFGVNDWADRNFMIIETPTNAKKQNKKEKVRFNFLFLWHYWYVFLSVFLYLSWNKCSCSVVVRDVL